MKSITKRGEAVTQESIDNVTNKKIESFTDKQNSIIYNCRKQLLQRIKEEKVGTEGSVAVSLDSNTTSNVIIGNIGNTNIENLNTPYYAIHNHPNNDVLSPGDILGFTSKKYLNMKGIEAIGNDGKTLFSMVKTDNSDIISYREYLITELEKFKSKYPNLNTDKDYDKMLDFSLNLFEKGEEYGFITKRN